VASRQKRHLRKQNRQSTATDSTIIGPEVYPFSNRDRNAGFVIRTTEDKIRHGRFPRGLFQAGPIRKGTKAPACIVNLKMSG
jgi:hypothetical protein